ncbi:MAG: hypothetical protein HYZ65_11920 [Burkholderiales bacterium]|nr:hypothetical protein [Burkholderiales bacterium]
MKLHLLKVLVQNEVRLRLRRRSTLVLMLLVIALAWAMLPAPGSGLAMIAIAEARVLYTSPALALGSATLAGPFFFGLAGFYLLRGSSAEDLRSGCGGVIAASPVGNALFLSGRWLGGVAFLLVLALLFLGAMLVCHVLRDEGPLQLGVYLQTYSLLLLPMILFAVSCATLFDSYAPLMGKAGDVLYFILWMAQISLVAGSEQVFRHGYSHLMLLDLSGLMLSMLSLKQHMQSDQIALGLASFDPALTPIALPGALWTLQMIWLRCATAALALLPLLPAFFLFHRYAPDRVKATRSRRRRSPLAWLNAGLRPWSGLVQPWFRLAAVLPGFGGQVVAELALSLASAPAALAALLLSMLAGLVLPAATLPAVLIAAVAAWACLICELSTRDFTARCEELSAAVAGGILRRYLRQLAATVMLGLLFMGIIALRWSFSEPLRAAALLSGLLSLSALATLAGRSSRSPRTFLAPFLFGLYVAVNETGLPILDVVGFNGVADLRSVVTQLLIAALAAAAGYVYNSRHAR